MTYSWHPLNTINRLLIDNLFLRFIEDRYKYMREVAQSRAILSLGISCFKLKKTKTSNDTKNKESEGRLNIRVKTYNIVVLCTENFIVEPASLKFLVGHGFDFNKQYASGVPYTRGDDKVGTPVSLEYVFFFLACYEDSESIGLMQEYCYMKNGLYVPIWYWLPICSSYRISAFCIGVQK